MYRPLSVIEGRDPTVLQTALDFYARPGARVLDVTANVRRIWRGVVWAGPIYHLDRDARVAPQVVGDFLQLPICDAAVDVVVFDPPHLPAAAGTARSASQTGITPEYGLRDSLRADHVGEWFAPFLQEAARVLVADGLLFAKLKDYVHNHRYQWQLARFIAAVEVTPGLTACDLLIKRDPSGGNLKSGRWQRAHHARNAHCWWVIVRKGGCEPRNVRLPS